MKRILLSFAIVAFVMAYVSSISTAATISSVKIGMVKKLDDPPKTAAKSCCAKAGEAKAGCCEKKGEAKAGEHKCAGHAGADAKKCDPAKCSHGKDAKAGCSGHKAEGEHKCSHGTEKAKTEESK